MAALVFPTAAEAASQTPVNTFSPTSTPLANTSNTNTYTYDTTLAVWKAAGAGITTAASSAEAKAGTSNTVYSSPQTAVPKDASGMTGAALMPGGNDAARPGTPATGMLRYNSQSGTPVSMEYYDGAAWTSAFGGGLTAGTAQSATGASVTFTGIPAGVKRITISVYEIESPAAPASAFLLRLGSGGSLTTSGYFSVNGRLAGGTSTVWTDTVAFIVGVKTNTSDKASGLVILTNPTGNAWVLSGNTYLIGYGPQFDAGSVLLPGTLDRLSLFPDAGNFSGGTINILYES